jgi:hypothetical protein
VDTRFVVVIDPSKRGGIGQGPWNPGRFYTKDEAIEKAKVFAAQYPEARFLVCAVVGSAQIAAAIYQEEVHGVLITR